MTEKANDDIQLDRNALYLPGRDYQSVKSNRKK